MGLSNTPTDLDAFYKLLAPTLFLSCHPRDDKLRTELVTHLFLLRTHGAQIIHNRFALPGEGVEKDDDVNLQNADIVVMLISADYLNSAYYREQVLPKMQACDGRRRQRFIPLIVRSCDWQHPPLSTLQALPKELRPVVLWRHRDKAWFEIVCTLRQIIIEADGPTRSRDEGRIMVCSGAVSNSSFRPNVIKVVTDDERSWGWSPMLPLRWCHAAHDPVEKRSGVSEIAIRTRTIVRWNEFECYTRLTETPVAARIPRVGWENR